MLAVLQLCKSKLKCMCAVSLFHMCSVLDLLPYLTWDLFQEAHSKSKRFIPCFYIHSYQ